MTNEEAKKMLEAKLKCLIAETSGTNHDCNMRLCDGCSLNYEQGNMGEQKQALDMAIKALEQQPCEDAISREALMQKLNAWDSRVHGIPNYAWKVIRELPSVTPERPNPDVVEKMKKAIDEMTEIHSDGEFYIKNVDAKWIINKYLYGAEMSGGEEE